MFQLWYVNTNNMKIRKNNKGSRETKKRKLGGTDLSDGIGEQGAKRWCPIPQFNSGFSFVILDGCCLLCAHSENDLRQEDKTLNIIPLKFHDFSLLLLYCISKACTTFKSDCQETLEQMTFLIQFNIQRSLLFVIHIAKIEEYRR